MTDNEIIKALECCNNGNCSGCPMSVDICCITRSREEAINLINRQKTEIDKFANIGKMYSEIKAETVKEFAERVKEKSSKLELVSSGALIKRDYTIDEKTLNNLVKEMGGEI